MCAPDGVYGETRRMDQGQQFRERPQHHWLSTYMQKTTWHSPHPWEDDDCDHEMGNQSSD